MSTKHLNYFDDHKNLILECPKCHWKGTFEQGSVEYYADLMDCACPQCDVFQAPILAEVMYPTTEELVANADRPGVGDWIVMAEKAIELYQERKLSRAGDEKLTQETETAQMQLFAKPDEKQSGPVLNLGAHGPMRPVPGVPGAYWERTETGTTLVSVPDPEWDKLPPEEQRSITQRMLKCLDLAQHLDRVTALRDEFTKIAGEETIPAAPSSQRESRRERWTER